VYIPASGIAKAGYVLQKFSPALQALFVGSLAADLIMRR
jgi:hypothetical protein